MYQCISPERLAMIGWPNSDIWGTLVSEICFTFFSGIILVYGLIGRLAWKKRFIPASKVHNSMRSQWKITSFMVQVLVMYGLCLVPSLITDQLLHADSLNINYVRILYLTSVLYVSTAWLNPIVYGMKDSSYRRAYHKLLPKCLMACIFRKVEDDSSSES